MKTDKSEDQTDIAYAGGFVTGLLTARSTPFATPRRTASFRLRCLIKRRMWFTACCRTCAERLLTRICSRKVGTLSIDCCFANPRKSWRLLCP